jgi:4-alpha-glucanotransferase
VKSDAHWQKIGLSPHHGISVALSSLRTKQSCGIGEFLDLIPLIDWCKKVGFDCIQMLPLNDTGDDPSPYNPISSCALDPIYLNLASLGSSTKPFETLTYQKRVGREEVLNLKMKWLRDLFEQSFDALFKTDAYQYFLNEHPWLELYSQYKVIKERLEVQNWSDWPKDYPEPEKGQTDFYKFLQYHCFSQMEKVKDYATENHVFLKGDIPILISPNSTDVWAHPERFRLDLEAGAPPDYYNPLGQKWGFPLLDWDFMREHDFVWWKQRLHTAEKLFHIYRLDHVVGFFRIWALPRGKQPLDGFFIPPDPEDWVPRGTEILEMMLSSTTMLPIAEDLGTIPKEVFPILKQLGICGTKVICWEKKLDKSYLPFDEYEPFSMTTISTHDSDTLELWWKKYPAESAAFAEFMNWTFDPILTADQRLQILKAAHHTPSYFHVNLLQEYLALFPELVSINPEEERINYPGTLLPTNWTYRLRPFLEEIAAHQELTELIQKILA